MLVAEFKLPSPEEREARKRELEAEIQVASMALTDPAAEEKVEAPQEVVPEMDMDDHPQVQEDADVLPSAPDLDALSED